MSKCAEHGLDVNTSLQMMKMSKDSKRNYAPYGAAIGTLSATPHAFILGDDAFHYAKPSGDFTSKLKGMAMERHGKFSIFPPHLAWKDVGEMLESGNPAIKEQGRKILSTYDELLKNKTLVKSVSKDFRSAMNRALMKSVGLGGAILGAGALGGTLLSKLVQKGVDLADRKKQ